jgi:lysophospholipase L1-like esterase
MSFGTNDAAPWKLVQMEIFKKNLMQIFKLFSAAHIVYFLPPPVQESESFPLPNRLLKQYYDSALEMAQLHQIDSIPSLDIFGQLLAKGDHYHLEDGVHLNDLGFAKLIENISKLVLARTAKQPRINPRRGV